MAAEWRASTWGEEITLEYGKALRGHDANTGQYRVFGSNGPIGWHDEYLAPGPGVILGRKGAYRGVEFSCNPFFVIDTAYYVVPKAEHDMRWLYFAIKHHKLGEIDDGSPIPSTTRAAVYHRELKVPPLPEQRAIAHILGTLDDKIEVNRKMAATLEAMARALFKSWFVDFDPVRAKAEGCDPGLPPHLTALFPDRLEETEQGEAPEGWLIGRLLDLCELKRGYDLPAARRNPGKYPIISSSGISGWHAEAAAQGPGVVTGRYGTIGQVFFVNQPFWPLNTSLYVCNFKKNSPRFVYYVLRELDFMRYSDKAAVPGINRNHLHLAPVVLPPSTLQEAFESTLKPMWERQQTIEAEICIFAALRDTLLPKLISGDLRIKDAERLLAERGL